KELPLVVTTNQATLTSPQARVARVDIPGGKPVAAPQSASVAPAAARPAPPSSAENRTASSPLSALGEAQPSPPPTIPAAPPAQSGSKRISYFVASKVNGTGSLRSGPGPNHNIVGTIAAGERYPIVDRASANDQTWYKIRLDSGAEVWVASALGHEVDE